MDITVIDSTAALEKVCRRFAAAEYITIDTEFRRQTTYWPELCLIQMACPDEALIIDPLTAGMDLAPFYKLMRNERVIKVFHAARQDIEIFYHEAGVIPTPLFDTQVAAMVCGFGDSVGYETLAAKLAGAKIDKSARFTDWTHRPLSREQLAYALADVTHLRQVYEALRKELAASHREPWLEEELAILTDPATYETDPRTAWQRLKTRSSSRRFLGTLREVAAWREIFAQKRDVPRSRIMRDDVLMQIAAHAPETGEALEKIRSVPKGFARGEDGRQLLAAIKKARSLPSEELPLAAKGKPGRRAGPAIVELLRVLLKMKSEEHRVAQKLIASSDDLEKLAGDADEGLPALHGWRWQVFGADAVKLKEGRIALSIDGEKVQAVEVPKPAKASRRAG